MRILIMLEQTETGFAAQAPDLAIATEAYREAGQQAPEGQSVSSHLQNPEFRDLLFTYVEVDEPQGRMAA